MEAADVEGAEDGVRAVDPGTRGPAVVAVPVRGTPVPDEAPVRWLDDTEQVAWRGLVAFVTVGLPRIERTFRAHGLVHLEYGILAVLSEHPDGLRLATVAGLLGVTPSRLTHRMAKLVQRGMVTQQPCPEDGRGTIARITARGRDLLEALAPLHVADVRATVFDHLDDDDVAHLASVLGRLASGLDVGLADAVGRPPATGSSDAGHDLDRPRHERPS